MQIPLAQEDLVSTRALTSCHLQASEQISKSAGETGWDKRGTGIRGLPGPTSGPERSLSGHPCEHELHLSPTSRRDNVGQNLRWGPGSGRSWIPPTEEKVPHPQPRGGTLD